MAALAGYGGSVSGAGTKITSWTATPTQEAIETTNMDGSGWREYVAGLKGATGSAECLETPPAVGSASLTLNTGSNTISGTALLTDIEYNVPVEGRVGFRFNFTFTGEVSAS